MLIEEFGTNLASIKAGLPKPMKVVSVKKLIVDQKFTACVRLLDPVLAAFTEAWSAEGGLDLPR